MNRIMVSYPPATPTGVSDRPRWTGGGFIFRHLWCLGGLFMIVAKQFVLMLVVSRVGHEGYESIEIRTSVC